MDSMSGAVQREYSYLGGVVCPDKFTEMMEIHNNNDGPGRGALTLETVKKG